MPSIPKTLGSLPSSWILLGQGFRTSLAPQAMLLALTGVFLVALTWRLSGLLFLHNDLAPRVEQFHDRMSAWPNRGDAGGLSALLPTTWTDGMNSAGPVDPVLGVPSRLAEPFRRLVDVDISQSVFIYYAVGGFLTLAIWSLLGGAIVRHAVVQIGPGRSICLTESVGFAYGNWSSLFAAPSFPIIGIALIGLPFVFLGWLASIDIGVIFAGLGWCVAIVAALLMAALALGLMLGWPLMWGAIAAEDSDAFDAISRSYAYTFQRPFHYLFYAGSAAALGLFGWILAWWFAESMIALSFWAMSWGCGGDRVSEIQQAMFVGNSDVTVTPAVRAGAWLIGSVNGIVRSCASAFSFAYFWNAAAAIYLLLRRDTDQTELDDVVMNQKD